MSELKKQIDDLRQSIEEKAYAREKADAASFSTQRRNDITATGRFFAQVAVALLWINENILKPVARFLAIPAMFLFRSYMKLWNRVVYVEDKFQNRLFSKTRAGLMLTISIAFVWFALLPLLGFCVDAGLYFATAKHNEVVYLTNSQEIVPEENVHSVQGCHALPCNDENSVYFRIRASAFNEVWSILHGHGLFYPDYVAAAVPLTISECHITSYGIRMKLMMRGMDIYPDVLTTTCRPLGETAPIQSPN